MKEEDVFNEQGEFNYKVCFEELIGKERPKEIEELDYFINSRGKELVRLFEWAGRKDEAYIYCYF